MIYDAVIIGTTYFCAGILSKSKKNIAVIDRNTLIGYEFINSLKCEENREIVSLFKNRDVFLASEISDISKKEGVFEIEFFSVSGFVKIKAKEVVDTTFCDEMIASKSLNALISGEEGRKILKCNADNLTYKEARKKLKNSLEKGYKIDYIAPFFDVTLKESKTASAYYKTSGEAFEAGKIFGEAL